jgi:hypothetical protein
MRKNITNRIVAENVLYRFGAKHFTWGDIDDVYSDLREAAGHGPALCPVKNRTRSNYLPEKRLSAISDLVVAIDTERQELRNEIREVL